MSTEQEVAVQFMSNHPDFLPCDLNSRLIQSYLDSTNPPLAFNLENLERAYADLDDQLAKKPQPKSKPIETSLPPVPSYFPKLETLADFERLSLDETRRLAKGPDAEKYKARLLAVQQQGYKNPQPATPQPETDQLDQYGLPVVEGADPAFLPNTVADFKKMGPNYSHMYRSKKFGPDFRKRVDAILERERRGGR